MKSILQDFCEDQVLVQGLPGSQKCSVRHRGEDGLSGIQDEDDVTQPGHALSLPPGWQC